MQITKLGSVRTKERAVKETVLVLGKEHGTILKTWAIMATLMPFSGLSILLLLLCRRPI